MGQSQTVALAVVGILTLVPAPTATSATPGPGDPGLTTEPRQLAQAYTGKAKPWGSHEPTQGAYPPQRQPAGPIAVRYQAYIAPPAKQRASGNTTLQPNQSYQLLAVPGPCGAAYVAQCQADSSGRVAAYFRDSCDTQGGTRGAWVMSGCSQAAYGASSVSCCR